MNLRWLITIMRDENGEELTMDRCLQYRPSNAYGDEGEWKDVPVRTEIYRTEEDGVQKLVEIKETP